MSGGAHQVSPWMGTSVGHFTAITSRLRQHQQWKTSPSVDEKRVEWLRTQWWQQQKHSSLWGEGEAALKSTISHWPEIMPHRTQWRRSLCIIIHVYTVGLLMVSAFWRTTETFSGVILFWYVVIWHTVMLGRVWQYDGCRCHGTKKAPGHQQPSC